MTKRRLGAVLTALAAGFAMSAVDAHASTCSYTGAAGGSWHAAINWSCDAVPSADADGIPDGDDAVLVALTDNVLVTSADAAAQSLTVDTGATLQFANDRALAVGGTSTFGQATMSGAGTLAANGAWTKSGTSTLNVSGVAMQLAAASTWTDGTICLNDSATFQLTGSLDVQSTADSVQHCSGVAGRLAIGAAGEFNVAGGDRFINTRFDNDGLVDLAGGTLTFSGTSEDTHAGHFAITNPAILRLSVATPLAAGAAIDGTGTLNQNAGTLTVPNTASSIPR